ncbi:MAG: DUF4595 domain-containing protein [Hoylesella marshii]|uniref:DUF4595 domain-containing protein n=1 Tax=Hoylesella marshii TaxID=189722 RepID=UPI003F9FBF1D
MKRIYALSIVFCLFASMAMAQTEKRLVKMKDGADWTEMKYHADGKLFTFTQTDHLDSGKQEIYVNTFTYNTHQIVMKCVTDNDPSTTDTWTSTLKNGLVEKDVVNINGNPDNDIFEYDYDAQQQLVHIKHTNDHNTDVTTVDITWTNGDIATVKTFYNGNLMSEDRYEYDMANDNKEIRVYLSPLASILSYEALPAGQLREGTYGVLCKHLYKASYVKSYSDPGSVQEVQDAAFTFTRNAEGLVTHISQLLDGDPQPNEYDLEWEDVTTGIAVNPATSAQPTYYNIEGVRLAQPERGLNLVRNADGSVRKIIR